MIPIDSFKEVKFVIPTVNEIDDEVLYATVIGSPFVRKANQSYVNGFLVSSFGDYVKNLYEGDKVNANFTRYHYKYSLHGLESKSRNVICKASIL